MILPGLAELAMQRSVYAVANTATGTAFQSHPAEKAKAWPGRIGVNAEARGQQHSRPDQGFPVTV